MNYIRSERNTTIIVIINDSESHVTVNDTNHRDIYLVLNIRRGNINIYNKKYSKGVGVNDHDDEGYQPTTNIIQFFCH